MYAKLLRDLIYAERDAFVLSVLLCIHALIVGAVDIRSQSIYDLNMTDFNMTDVSASALPLLDRTDAHFVIAHRWLIPPDIRLDGEMLRYGEFSSRAKWVVHPAIKLLDAFTRLATSEPGEVVGFARRWGVLGLCQHGLVADHERYPGLADEPCRLQYAEAVERWRYYADAMKRALEEGAKLRGQRKLGAQSARATKRIEDFLLVCRRLVLYFGGLRPVLVVEGGRFEIKLSGASYSTGLAAALTTQFLFAVAGAAGIASCAGCGALFMPRRRPAKNRRSYCTECGIRAAWRYAQQRRRQDATRKQRREATER
jgi:hypothetical protein